jgi:Co/Zn/Cd efflux system component
MMGAAAWLLAALLAFGLARIIPVHRTAAWLEVLVALLGSLLAGMGATAMDFGGWAEPDPRAFVFAFLISSALIGLTRAVSMAQRPTDS